MKARWWKALPADQVQCQLCFRQCVLVDGKKGFCGVRENRNGMLESPYLGYFCSMGKDPVEKKPLFHWRPGSFILSLGSIGCTMRCPFCQNHSIAQPVSIPAMRFLSGRSCIDLCHLHRVDSIAFTYNEPTLQAEYICDIAPQLHTEGIDVVLVTNGMFLAEAAEALVPHVSAVNMDVKTFSAKNYTRMGGDLERVKANAELFVRAGRHVEITMLVVPGLADDYADFGQFVDWLAVLGSEIPLHLSRYFPAHRYNEPPTSLETLRNFKELAQKKLAHVHLGNVR